MRLEDVFRFLEARMPGVQGPDGQLRRTISMTGWSKLKTDLEEIVKKSGGIAVTLPPSKALVVQPSVPPDPPGPAEVNEEFFPVINGETHPRALL